MSSFDFKRLPRTTGLLAVVAITTVASPSSDLSLTLLDSPDPVTIGNTLTYTLIVSNGGPATATFVKLTNTLPAGVTFLSASPSGYVVNGNIITFPSLGDMGSGSSVTATILVRPDVPGTITDNASVGSTTTDPLKANNSASVKTVVESVQLSVTRVGSNIVISWPASASGYVLESAPDLHAPIIWTVVTTPPAQLVGDQKTVTIPATNASLFFRLHAGP